MQPSLSRIKAGEFEFKWLFFSSDTVHCMRQAIDILFRGVVQLESAKYSSKIRGVQVEDLALSGLIF
jgi:hypothetical protein